MLMYSSLQYPHEVGKCCDPHFTDRKLSQRLRARITDIYEPKDTDKCPLGFTKTTKEVTFLSKVTNLLRYFSVIS